MEIQYNNSMMNTVLKWTATVVTILGALAVVFKLDPLNIWLFNIGSLIWLVWAFRIREYSIVLVNAVMILIYASGLIMRI
jgi:energy-converting hydrogenase Eha subunit C